MSLHRLPLGWHTDLAVLRLGGSVIEERSDHLVVRTPQNPSSHWGNFVLVTDPDASDDADRWATIFQEEFPDAGHRSIGLVTAPSAPDPWLARGLSLDRDDVMAADSFPDPSPVPAGHLIRQIQDAGDWEQSTRLRVAEFADGHADRVAFMQWSTQVRRVMSESGDVAWFGAFHLDRLVAELGIVDCGRRIARYQSVVTATEHRRHGLAAHLLGVAAQWAAERGVRRRVIVADADSAASRLYARHGFSATDPGFRAHSRSDAV